MKNHPLQLISLFTVFILFSCKKNLKIPLQQPLLGSKTATIIEKDGFRFKDLNNNQVLDPYEDWRLTPSQRSEDLRKKMTLEQKAGLMLLSSTRLENDWSFGRPQNSDPIKSGFNEMDQTNELNVFTKKPLESPFMFVAGTTKDVTQFHKRHFILRVNTSPKNIAEWNNKLQALCEEDELGIPATVTSNPRNHITNNAAVGLSLGETTFSQWPGELGLAASRDFNLIREFADIARQEWLSVGIRKGYMYMADLATEPRWQRVEGTFGEDAQLAADCIKAIVLGFQGETLSSESIALTTKHFPGGGAAENGQDPHFEWGKREVFEAGMFENNLIPFKAAIEAGTSAIMPYYSFPVKTKYEEVAYAFNKPILTDLLRNQLGFEGIINSDTGPIEMMPWGVEHLSVEERYTMAIEAGINIFSGSADPNPLINTLKNNPNLMSFVDDSVERLLKEKFRLGLFENPYVAIENATNTVGNKNFQKKAEEAHRKSIVLLRNKVKQGSSTLPLKSKVKVYFEIYKNQKETASHIYKPVEERKDLVFVNRPEDADINLIWIFPQGQSLFDSSPEPVHVNLAANKVNTSYINKLIAEKPTILAINYTTPWAIDEIYSENEPNIQGVLATFGTTAEALLDIVSGRSNPSAKMPFSTPASDEKAQNQKSDLPGYSEGNDYALFNFDEGLSYD